MRFEELEEKSYYRDRTEMIDKDYGDIAYFEEIRFNKIKNGEAEVERIHIHFDNDGIKETSPDKMTFNRKGWHSGWHTIEFVSKTEMYRRVIKYVWEL